MANRSKETPEERKARIAAWHQQHEEKRQAVAEQRRLEKKLHRESYDDRNEGKGHALYPKDEEDTELLLDEAAESEPRTLTEKQRRKQKLSKWYETVIKDEEICMKDRLNAAAQLQRLEGFEKQEVEVKVDGLTQFFDAQLKLIQQQPLAWQKKHKVIKDQEKLPK